MIEIRHTGVENTNISASLYNQIYQTQGILHRDSFYVYLIELLRPSPGGTLLDISCGEGRLSWLANQMGLHTIGLDISMSALKKAKKESNRENWINADAEALPLASSSIDYVTNIGSIEHYLNPHKGVREIARVLKPKGKACILLPNAFGLLGNILYVARFGEVFDDGQPLQRYATRNTWENLLTSNGLEIVKVIPYHEIELPRTPKDWLWFLSRPKKIIRWLLSTLIPTNLSNHLIFICKPQVP